MPANDGAPRSAVQAWHRRCFVCGPGNEHGLRMHFAENPDGSVESTVVCDPSYSGYPGQLHGGIVASLLDAAMTNCLFCRNLPVATVDLRIRYRHPVRPAVPIRVSARITKSRTLFHVAEAELIQGELVRAEAVGKFLLQKHYRKEEPTPDEPPADATICENSSCIGSSCTARRVE